MTTQLSWQPPPVTKCGECPKFEVGDWTMHDGCGMAAFSPKNVKGKKLYEKNKDGITPTCPAWQQQNKEVK